MSARTKKLEDSASGSQDSGGSSDAAFPRAIVPRQFPAGPPPAALSKLPVVERSRYVIEGDLARGGVGRILRGRDARLGRPVAIKELRFDPLGPGATRFVREVMITAKLSHPSIVTLFEAGRWPSGEPFFAMELVDGRSLAAAIAERATLEERLPMLQHVIAAAEAMAYAHSRHIVHRDLKPSNILVGSFGETVVIDWGLAKDLEDGGSPDASPPSIARPPGAGNGLTAAGAVVGTPAYMPPEQAAGERVDASADVYALGALLYHVVSGAAPYEASSPALVIRQVLRGPPRPLEEREPHVPRALLAIVQKAMARERDARYPSARELAEDLRRFAHGQFAGAQGRWRLRSLVRRNQAWVAVFVLIIVVLAIVGVLR